MKHPSLTQATKNLGLCAGSPRPEHEKNAAASAEAAIQRSRSPGAMAERRIDDDGKSRQHQRADDIECRQRININHHIVKFLATKKPHIHAPAAKVMPNRNGTVENFMPASTGTTMEAKNTMPIFRNISWTKRAWLSDSIHSYHSTLQWHVKAKNFTSRLRNKILLRIKLWRTAPFRIKLQRTRRMLATALSISPHLYYRCGGVLVFAALMWGMNPGISIAENPAGTIIKGTVAKLGQATATIAGVYAILALLQEILSLGLGIVGGFLDFAFNLNVVINPGQLAVVQSGWTLLRDLANGLFILLLLWIAITIIFNLEGLGGKKLLVRVILVALLINFSLAMVSTVFAFGNELAKPFARAMGVLPTCTAAPCEKQKTTLSQLIINNSQIHETTQVVVAEGAIERAQKELEAANKQPPAPVEPFTGGQSTFRSVGNYLGAPPTASAVIQFIPILVWLGWAAAGAIASALATSLAFSVAHAFGLDAWVFKSIFNMVVADAFLFLTISAMFTAAVVLLLRLVAMVFLGVFAPIAFLGLAFPKYGNLAWSKWIDNLVRWTFTAPIFYFLLYLSLLMLQANRSGGEAVFKEIPFTANFFKMLNLVLFLVFLWAAVYMTKKTAGHFADVALSLGRKALGFTAGVATGFVARRALPKLGQAAEAGGRAIGRVQSPLFRGILRTPAKILRRTATAGRQQVLEAQGRIGSMTSVEIQRAIGAGEFGEADLAAAMLVLQTRGQTTPISGVAGYGEAQQRRGGDTIRRLGLNITDFLRGNPSLARPGDFTSAQLAKELTEAAAKLGRAATDFEENEIAQRLAWQRVKPENLRTMDLDILNPDTDTGKRMIEQFIEFGKGTHFSELMRVNPTTGGKVQDYLNANPALVSRMDPQAITYFQTNAAQSFGWKLPPGTAPPPGTPPVIPSTSIPAWTAGTANSFTPRVTGGIGAMTWRFAAGFTRPTWLTINPGTGIVSADAAAPSGTTLAVPIEVEDGTGAVSVQTFLIRIT